jgi:hypothetical protein
MNLPIEPEVTCEACDGNTDRFGVCRVCGGAGVVMSPFGQLLLDYMRKHLTALLAELGVPTNPPGC